MPRRARLVVPGIPWHVIQRGNNRTACFYADDDYQYYLETLFKQANKYDCAVHAYCLMTNHVHLLLTPAREESASMLMKHLGQRYVQYINRTYRRSGTLWEGRFRSCLAQDETYVLACYRYIELNPVRAGMVEHPGEYRWSSYRVNGQGAQSGGIVPHPEYLRLGKDVDDRQQVYRGLFETHIERTLITEIRQATNGNYALGNDRFKDEVAKILSRRVTPGKSGRPSKGR